MRMILDELQPPEKFPKDVTCRKRCGHFLVILSVTNHHACLRTGT